VIDEIGPYFVGALRLRGRCQGREEQRREEQRRRRSQNL
jgi:hypothetical protein